MKRILLFILSFIYLTVASGVVLSVHYCMGKQTTLRYSIHASNKCDKCGMKNNGCCHDEYRFIKLTLDQQLTKTDGHGQVYNCSFAYYPTVSLMPVAAARVHAVDLYFSPPDKREARLFKFTCTYRI